LTSLYIIFKKHKVSFTFPKYNIIRNQLFESFPIFTSNISLQLYLGTNKVIIGLLLGMHEVSYYDLGEKLLNLIKIPILAVSQVLFPKLANDFNRNFLLKVGFFATIFTLIIILSILFFTINIIDFIAGKNMIGAITTVVF
jgi:PST family polysaccharide transporter